jgi:hypothetical protein
MLAGWLWLQQDSEGASPYVGTYTRRTGELSGCYTWPLRGPFEVGPCLTLALEDVTVRGGGPDVAAESGHAIWPTLGAAARVEWSLGRWVALFVRPGMTFAPARPTFAIHGVGPVYEVPVAAFDVNIGSEWIW